jgi:hypothetical protein
LVALLGLALTVLAMLAVGLVLFSALCRLAGAGPDFFPQPRDRLMIGPLPGLALVVLLVTILSLLHLVRAWVMAPLALLILVGLRRDTVAVWDAVKDATAATIAAVRAGDLFPLAALVVGAAVTYVGLFLCFIPASNVDVWVYHLPLVQSIVSHAGFAYPQIDNLFYGSQPMALEMLHGAGMVFFNHFAIASAINLAIYLSLAVLAVACIPRGRGFLFLLLCYLFVVRLELQSAATPMIDTPRACLSIAAFLFAWRYAWTFRRMDLILSALVAGLAVAAKTTELVNVLIICATLAPFIWRRGTWRDLIPAAGIFAAVSSYWYIKNLVLYGNPVYPFIFGHPGLSDAWIRDLMLEMTRPFDVADRGYSTNLITAQGWHDFIVVMGAKFFWLKRPALIVLLGLALPWPRRWMLPLWSGLLFLFWYAQMFNHIRWAITAVLLLTLTAFMVVGFATSHLVDAWEGKGPLARWIAPWRRPGAVRVLPASLSALLVIFLVFVAVRIDQGKGHSFIPPWMDANMVTALTRTGDPERYLSQTREEFELYRYIGRHNLARVFQPYDNGGTLFVSAYNDGQDNRWLVHFTMMPASLAQADAFIARQRIRYFIRKPLDPTDVERLGPAHVALADAMIARLKPHARLLLRDRFGEELYEILPGARIGAKDRKGASAS